MVSRQTSAGHAATNTNTNAASSSASSIKPTGWIRSESVSRPALGDRTNFPSGSRSTPLRSLSKPAVQSTGKRSTPLTNGAASKQPKLSRFFAPNTAPPASFKGKGVDLTRSTSLQNSPSVARARGKSADAAQFKTIAASDDEELEARAASLLRGRFGSVSRSLVPTRSSTPAHAPSPPRSEPDPPRPIPRSTMQTPASMQAQDQLRSRLVPSKAPRPPPAEQHPSSSPPPFEPTLMAESLSNFTPPSWETSSRSRMAMFKRLAGVSKAEILEAEKAMMAEQVAKAHARMQSRSPASPSKTGSGERQKVASPRKNRIKQAAALASSSPKRQVEAVLRSPRTNRRIYALETQLGGESLGLRAVSLQPMVSTDGGSEGRAPAGQRRAISEASAAGPSSFRQSMLFNDPFTLNPAEADDDSETQVLPWPEEGKEAELAAVAHASGDSDADGDETQPLPWEDEKDEAHVGPATDCIAPYQAEDAQDSASAEVPPSDDEDLLRQRVFSSSPSISPSPSPSTSPSRLPSLQRTSSRRQTPLAKRPRIKQEEDPPMTSPTFARSHRISQMVTPRPLPTISPISLTPSIAGGPDRYGQVVAALKKSERRQNSGMQLSLNFYLSSSSSAERAAEERRHGLSEDLDDMLSDDDDGRDTTVTNLVPNHAEVGGQGESDETQPLAWDSSPTQVEPHLIRPKPLPLQSAGSSPVRTSQPSATSSSSSGIIPSQNISNDEGNTQWRTFFRDL